MVESGLFSHLLFFGNPINSRLQIVHGVAYWDAEAQQVPRLDDQPLAFENLTTIGDHDEHKSTLDYLHDAKIPAVVIAGSGMCTGGRVVNYLKAFLDDANTDVVFVGYQGQGTPGRDIQAGQGDVELDGRRYRIRAKVHSLAGYSAHANQKNLLDYVEKMPQPPGEIVLVHGERDAKRVLRGRLEKAGHRVR